jgi:hypothetical protein
MGFNLRAEGLLEERALIGLLTSGGRVSLNGGLLTWGGRSVRGAGYLVDPASNHMLVSKIKPCMSKYKQLYSETAEGSLNQL